jgi:uncharacterized protein (DUF2147 family)
MRLRVLPVFALALLSLPAAAQAAASIAGRWVAEDGTAVVTIAPCASSAAAYCGRVTRFLVAEPKGGFRDTKNPDPKLRNRPVLGATVFTGLVATGKAWKGRGYSVKDGRHFAATLSAKGAKLTVRGCVTIICRTVVWTRA